MSERNARRKIRSISESRARSPRLVQVQLGQIVEPHIAWGYFITRETARERKKEEDGSRAILTFTTPGPPFNRELLEEESRFEINLAGHGIPTCEWPSEALTAQ